MNNKQLLAILKKNEINYGRLEDIVYNTLIFSIFEILCKEIRNNKIEVSIANSFRKNRNHILVVEKLINEFIGCKLTNREYEIIYKMLLAFLRKGNNRKLYSEVVKNNLLSIQNNRCPICNSAIDINNSELDHKVAWHYVGDELEDNLQMLCRSCNEKKNKSVTFELQMLLYNKYNNVNSGQKKIV